MKSDKLVVFAQDARYTTLQCGGHAPSTVSMAALTFLTPRAP